MKLPVLLNIRKLHSRIPQRWQPERWFISVLLVYYELLFHLWIGKPFTFTGVLCLVGFALCIGAVFDFLLSWIPKRISGICAGLLGALLAVLFMAEYFIGDAFHSYMKPSQMAFGAGGIMNDYMDVVLQQMQTNLGKILLVLLPPIGFLAKVKVSKPDSRVRQSTAYLMLTIIGLGVGLSALGIQSLSGKYDFNTAVQTQGICLSMFQELSGQGEGGSANDLVVVPPAPTVETTSVQRVEEGDPAEPSFVPEPHLIPNLDFEKLAGSSGNQDKLSAYITSLPPGYTNEYTGMFKGKNLILIMAEAFTTQVIDEELTPTLYRMANKGIRFTDYYQPLWNGSTIGGEMSILSGLVPNMATGMGSYAAQRPFNTLGAQCAAQGYFTRVFHNNTASFYERTSSHFSLGYEKYIAMDSGMEKGVKNEWPQSDLEMIDFTVPTLIENQPFSVYYITVSGHSMYTMKGNAQARKNWDAVKDLPYSEPVRIYLAANLELEKAMASLIRQLEDAGIADDTVIVLSADHYPYGLDSGAAWGNTSSYIAELKGVDSYDDFTRDSSTLIIWSGCLEDKDITVTAPTYSLDILPTVSNLFGFDYDSRLSVGRDVLSNEEPIVLWPNYSWITEKGRYNADTEVFTPAEGAEVSEEYLTRINAIVKNKINFSRSVQADRYLSFLRIKMKQAQEANQQAE